MRLCFVTDEHQVAWRDSKWWHITHLGKIFQISLLSLGFIKLVCILTIIVVIIGRFFVNYFIELKVCWSIIFPFNVTKFHQ